MRARRVIVDRSGEVAFWVGLRIPAVRARMESEKTASPFGNCVAFAVLDENDQVIAGVIYHAWVPAFRGIEVSCAATSRTWATPDVVREILRYPFAEAGCIRVTAVTPRSGTSSRRFLEGLGFKREGSIRRGFGSENAIVYGLLAEEWAVHRLNQPRKGALSHGEEGSRSAAAA